jgi:FkbM family methyltransferase
MRLPTRAKLTIARVLSRAAIGWLPSGTDPRRARVRRRGIDWELDLHEGIDLSLYLFGCFERSTTALVIRLLRPGDIAIDVGANIGALTLPMARAVGHEGRVLAFEPTCYGLARLRRACDMNPWAKGIVTVEQARLTCGTTLALEGAVAARWPLDRKLDPSTPHGGVGESTQGACAYSLDQYMDTHRVGSPRLIKIDVDGAEFQVIAGAARTVVRFKPELIVELTPVVHFAPENVQSTSEAIRLLDRLGYRAAEAGHTPTLRIQHLIERLRVPAGASVNLHMTSSR